MNGLSETSGFDDAFCGVVSTMGDSKNFLTIRGWSEEAMRGSSMDALPSSCNVMETLQDVGRATMVAQAVRVGIVDVGRGIVECHNIFESSWRLKSFFEGAGKSYDGSRDYAGSVLVACREFPNRAVWQSFGVTPLEWAAKASELRRVGVVVSRNVDYDGMRPAMSIQQRGKWGFIKDNVDKREGFWKTGNSTRLLAGFSEEINLHSQDDINLAYDEIFQKWRYKRDDIVRTTPGEDCYIVAVSYKHCGPNRMSREDFSTIAASLRKYFKTVRLWLDACIKPGSDIIKWVHIGLTPYVCIPVVILRNSAYEEGYERVWITLERRLAQKGCDVICVGSERNLEQCQGISEHDNLKSICSDLLGGRIDKKGLSVASDYDDLLKWAKSVLMLPGGVVPNVAEAENSLDEYYSSAFAKKVLMSNELSKVNGGSERDWIERSPEQETNCWTSKTLYGVEDGFPLGEGSDSLPGEVLNNVIVLDVVRGTPDKVYESPCWFATPEGSLIIYKIRVKVSQSGSKKQVVGIRKLPCAMLRPYEDLLAECMLLGSTKVEVRSGSHHVHEMWLTTPATYNIIKGVEANWE